MDAQLQELIETIKSEGVQTAEKQAEQIVASAEEKAAEIVQSAEKRAADLIASAHTEQEKLDHAGREALQQAGRDLILSVQNRLGEMFSAIVETATSEAISADVLENAIATVVSAWSEGKTGPVDVLIGASDLERVEKRLRSRLAEKLKGGTEIKIADTVKSGFRVGTKDGALYYDFTAESIAEALYAYVGPRLRDVLRDAAADRK